MIRVFVIALLVVAAYCSMLPSIPQFAMSRDKIAAVQEGRIVGGQNADIREAPYQVAGLLSRTGGPYSLICGGSIIRANAILSAAYCSDGTTPSMWQIRAGSTFSNSGGQIYSVSRIANHPLYSPWYSRDFDVSILFLSASIEINSVTTRIIPLPVQNAVVADDAPAFVTGWGSIRSEGPTVTTLQKITIPIVNQTTCSTVYYGNATITTRMICAGNLVTGIPSPCTGDEGGPLTVNGILIGVTSWGKSCGRPVTPGVWARVPFFISWIDMELENSI